jgi:hypothetical protein
MHNTLPALKGKFHQLTALFVQSGHLNPCKLQHSQVQPTKSSSRDFLFCLSQLQYYSSSAHTMKVRVVAALFSVQASLVSAFQLPFKLPFDLNFLFGKETAPELFTLHKALINIPSITGSEHDVGVFIAEYLKERNYTVERIPSCFDYVWYQLTN